jgi:hypothetical protein
VQISNEFILRKVSKMNTFSHAIRRNMQILNIFDIKSRPTQQKIQFSVLLLFAECIHIIKFEKRHWKKRKKYTQNVETANVRRTHIQLIINYNNEMEQAWARLKKLLSRSFTSHSLTHSYTHNFFK